MSPELKSALKSETRNWLGRGVIPPIAAENRRHLALVFPAVADVHLAFAAEWDRITSKFPDRVRAAYQKREAHAVQCASNQVPGSALQNYWQHQAKWWHDEAEKYADKA